MAVPEKAVIADPTQRAGESEGLRSGRNADVTRRLLVRAARRRFAESGYRATTVRQIAADAGVNVALINRYFGSKDGLFEECLAGTASELKPDTNVEPGDLDAIVARLVLHILNAPDSDDPLQLLLLLRSSGDVQADRIRVEVLESFTRQLAEAAGWRPADPTTEPLLLRAQVVIATLLGMITLRATLELEPMRSANAEQLAGTLIAILRALLQPPFVAGTEPQ